MILILNAYIQDLGKSFQNVLAIDIELIIEIKLILLIVDRN